MKNIFKRLGIKGHKKKEKKHVQFADEVTINTYNDQDEVEEKIEDVIQTKNQAIAHEEPNDIASQIEKQQTDILMKRREEEGRKDDKNVLSEEEQEQLEREKRNISVYLPQQNKNRDAKISASEQTESSEKISANTTENKRRPRGLDRSAALTQMTNMSRLEQANKEAANKEEIKDNQSASPKMKR